MATVRYLVSDVARSMAFYRELLEFEDGFDMLPAFAMVRRGDLVPVAGRPVVVRRARRCPTAGRRSPAAGTGSSIEVEDLDAIVERLREAGATFRNDIVKGPGGRQILVDDPDGNPIELFEART